MAPLEMETMDPYVVLRNGLPQIALSCQQGHHRNLLVSATGTGKTVMAALDYLRLREEATSRSRFPSRDQRCLVEVE